MNNILESDLRFKSIEKELLKQNQLKKIQQAENLDQFFTKKDLAIRYLNILKEYLIANNIQQNRWLEPSAGSGSFFNLLPKEDRLGIDISPKIPEVIDSDFLKYNLIEKDYITIGNPPFGKNSSLAIKFFNKCSLHSKVVAFIVPKTFKKHSVISKLDDNFHLELSEDVPDYGFELEGKSYNVPCVFQIWVKKDKKREKVIISRIHKDFIFCKKEEASFAIQRVGANAGRIKTDLKKIAIASHYFLKATDEVKKIFEQINWNNVKYNTAGNPSISKIELVNLYQEYKK